MCVRTRVYVCICECVYVRVCMYVYVSVCTYACVYMSVYMYLFSLVFSLGQRGGEMPLNTLHTSFSKVSPVFQPVLSIHIQREEISAKNELPRNLLLFTKLTKTSRAQNCVL